MLARNGHGDADGVCIFLLPTSFAGNRSRPRPSRSVSAAWKRVRLSVLPWPHGAVVAVAAAA